MVQAESSPTGPQNSFTSRVKPTSGMTARFMTKETQVRTSAVLLALSTVAVVVFAWINLQKEAEFIMPSDGVWWLERSGGLVADRVQNEGPGQRGGIKLGDRLVAINGRPTKTIADVTRNLYRAGVWSKATYTLARNTVQLDVPVIIGPADRSFWAGLRLIALVYLGIGIYVLFRRWTAPKSTHFYIFCLVSSILYSFHYTGKLNAFDSIVLWANISAWLLQPALFLHFAYTFPKKRKAVAKRPWLLAFVYLPAAVLMAIRIAA